MRTPEDEFNDIIDAIELRAMAVDGPVTPTLQEATEAELSRLWELVNEISPKRKALARKILKVELCPIEEVHEYLRQEGLDPKQIAREGSTFVKTIQSKLELERQLEKFKWIKSEDEMPAYNVSALVFIPEEDNHITVGMWDVSNKWILLDDYREPRSEVTYWMAMINEPEDKKFKKLRFLPEEDESLSFEIRRLQKQVFDLNKEIAQLKKL